jgi:fatty-acyl-CoA synthase
MMDFQLTVPAILRRAEALGSRQPIVSRLPDRCLGRSTYAEVATRAHRLAAALRHLGIRPGDRVATLAWNHVGHLEAYFGISLAGAVLHTLNLRLHPEELAYIAGHAEDRAVIVDAALLPLLARFRDRAPFEHVVVVGERLVETAGLPGTIDYEDLLSQPGPDPVPALEPREDDAAALCYTTGTTGKPKGVLYSHRALVLHTLGCALPDAFDLGERDIVMPVVPMFHANAWGLPYTAALLGAGLVLPGAHLDPGSLVELIAWEGVTFTAAVPTVWLGVLQWLDNHPGAVDLSRLRTIVSGGAPAPRAMIEGFERRHGVRVVHSWGMTEMTPVGTVSRPAPDLDAALAPDMLSALRAKQGRPLPLVEVRARHGGTLVPWDGATMGELEVRGPWVAAGYYRDGRAEDRVTPDGWFRTGDIVTIDARGYISIQDRAKDLIKSGGEWISSVALESALMNHPDVAEAAVVAVQHPRWGERPVAAVVLRPDTAVTVEALREYLGERFARWWVPDVIDIVEAIPKTSVGKFQKSALRERYRDLILR